MSDTHHDAHGYTPPTIWTWTPGHGGRFANINRPIAGPTHEQALPVGKHPLQLYSLGTPNGVKVTVMLEELLAAGHTGAEYDAWLIRIHEGRAVRLGLCRGQPQLQNPGADGPQRARAHPGLRVGGDPHVPG
jgi:GST-like protein